MWLSGGSLQRIREAAVDNQVWVGHGVICEAVKSKVNLVDARLDAFDVGGELAQAVLIALAALQTGERDNRVVENPADVGGCAVSGAGKHLCDEVGRKRRDVADDPLLAT